MTEHVNYLSFTTCNCFSGKILPPTSHLQSGKLGCKFAIKHWLIWPFVLMSSVFLIRKRLLEATHQETRGILDYKFSSPTPFETQCFWKDTLCIFLILIISDFCVEDDSTWQHWSVWVFLFLSCWLLLFKSRNLDINHQIHPYLEGLENT